MASTKTTDKKDDFIKILSSMSDTEINDYIKKHGKGPKKVLMCHVLTKEELEDYISKLQ